MQNQPRRGRRRILQIAIDRTLGLTGHRLDNPWRKVQRHVSSLRFLRSEVYCNVERPLSSPANMATMRVSCNLRNSTLVNAKLKPLMRASSTDQKLRGGVEQCMGELGFKINTCRVTAS